MIVSNIADDPQSSYYVGDTASFHTSCSLLCVMSRATTCGQSFNNLCHGPRPAVSPSTNYDTGHDLRSALQQTMTRATTCGQPFNKLWHGPRPAVSPSTNNVTGHDLRSALQHTVSRATTCSQPFDKNFSKIYCVGRVGPVVLRICLPTILMGPAHSCKIFKF
jgi:hypothetical protein